MDGRNRVRSVFNANVIKLYGTINSHITAMHSTTGAWVFAITSYNGSVYTSKRNKRVNDVRAGQKSLYVVLVRIN